MAYLTMISGICDRSSYAVLLQPTLHPLTSASALTALYAAAFDETLVLLRKLRYQLLIQAMASSSHEPPVPPVLAASRKPLVLTSLTMRRTVDSEMPNWLDAIAAFCLSWRTGSSEHQKRYSSAFSFSLSVSCLPRASLDAAESTTSPAEPTIVRSPADFLYSSGRRFIMSCGRLERSTS